MAAPLAAVAVGAGAMAAGALATDKAKLKPSVAKYADELAGNLEAQANIAPRKLELEKQYAPQYAELTNQLIRDHGPGYAQAQRKAAGTEHIIDQLIGQAESELNAGAGLDPALASELSQNIRAGQAARGFGFSLPDVGAEAALTAAEMENMRRARQAYAMNVANVASQSIGGPGMVGAVTNQGPFFNPESQYAYGVNRQNQANIQQSNAAKFQKQMAIGSGLMNMGGSMMGAGLGGMGGGATGGGGMMPVPPVQQYSNMYYGGKVPWQLQVPGNIYE